MKINIVQAQMDATGLVTVTAYVEDRKQPHTMHIIVTNLDENWPQYSLTTDFGFSVSRTSRWDLERSVEIQFPSFKKLASLMFVAGYELIEANKPEPEPEPEDDDGE